MSDLPFEDELIRTINRRLFQLGLAACGTIIILAAVVAMLALKPRLPPYIAEVSNGRIIGYAHAFAGNSQLSEQIIEQQLKQFIYNARVVTANDEFEQRNIHSVYALARSQASQALDAYYQASPDNDPVLLGRKGYWRDVHIIRCLREPEPDTYRIEWTETLHPKNGDAVTSSWEATLKVVMGPPDTSNDLNPLGIYVIALDMEEAQSK